MGWGVGEQGWGEMNFSSCLSSSSADHPPLSSPCPGGMIGDGESRRILDVVDHRLQAGGVWVWGKCVGVRVWG